MTRALLFIIGLIALSLGGEPAQSQNVNLNCWNPTGSGLTQWVPCNSTTPLQVVGTLGGFAPNGNFANLTASNTSGSVALPSGSVVVFSNTGTTTVSCTLGIGSATAVANEIQVPASSSIAVTVGVNTFGACIDQTGSTSNVVALTGGAGLFTGFGGGGGSSSSSSGGGGGYGFGTSFQSGGVFATLTATGSSASVALPAGNAVVIQNAGTTTVSCTLGIGSATAAANEIIVPANSAVETPVGSNTFGACIDQTGSVSNLVVIVGGTDSIVNGTVALGQTTKALSVPVTIASDQGMNASATGGATYAHVAAGQATTVIKASAGNLFSICLNSAATATNTTNAYDNPSTSGTVIATVAATTATVPTCLQYGPAGIAFVNGLTIITATANGADMTIAFK